MGVPPKVRHFLCRACNDALPSLQALCRRGIPLDPTCPACGEAPESLSHILLRCPVAVHSWGRNPIHLILHGTEPLEFRPILWSIMKSLPDYGVSLFALIAWNLWKARNKRHFDNVVQKPGQIVSWALDVAAGIQSTRGRKNGIDASGSMLGKWFPPPPGKLKLNSDAGVFSDGTVGLGFIVRNNLGKMILAGTRQCLVTANNSTMVEALALRFGVSSALNHGLQIDHLESDSSNLVQAITNNLEVDVL
ncbi:hypothetical protein ACS0TY_033055 [Phlomoides rotata]